MAQYGAAAPAANGSGFAQPATLGVTLVIAYAEAAGAPAAFLPATQIVPASSTVRPVHGCPSNPSPASAQEKSFVPLPVASAGFGHTTTSLPSMQYSAWLAVT